MQASVVAWPVDICIGIGSQAEGSLTLRVIRCPPSSNVPEVHRICLALELTQPVITSPWGDEWSANKETAALPAASLQQGMVGESHPMQGLVRHKQH